MRIPSSEAKAVLADLIRKAEAGETIELTRYGNTTAVLISKERYNRLSRDLFTEG